MASDSITEELWQLEHDYWQAIKDKDARAASELSDEPCLVAGAQGVGSVDRQTLMTMMDSASYQLQSFELNDNAFVRMLADDVAILAYKVQEELLVDGKKVSLDAADSSTWVRRDGHWRCALHTEALAGDPFGRDRKKNGAKHKAS
jgi:hypothetical protein